MTCDAKTAAYFRDPAANTCELVYMHEIDFAAAKRIDPANWSRSPFAGMLQVTAYSPHAERLGMAVQQEAGGPYVILAGAYAGKRVDPRSAAAAGVAVAPAVAERGPEQSPEHPALFLSEWQNLIGTDGPPN